MASGQHLYRPRSREGCSGPIRCGSSGRPVSRSPTTAALANTGSLTSTVAGHSRAMVGSPAQTLRATGLAESYETRVYRDGFSAYISGRYGVYEKCAGLSPALPRSQAQTEGLKLCLAGRCLNYGRDNSRKQRNVEFNIDHPTRRPTAETCDMKLTSAHRLSLLPRRLLCTAGDLCWAASSTSRDVANSPGNRGLEVDDQRQHHATHRPVASR